MKALISIMITLSFSPVFAGTARAPVVFDNILSKSISEKKERTSEMSYLMEEAEYKEKTKSALRIVEKANKNRKKSQ
jgi:hypothetical protein